MLESSYLHIHLLGEFSLTWDDKVITTINTPRLKALLAYLLLHRSAPQARRQLAFTFFEPKTTSSSSGRI